MRGVEEQRKRNKGKKANKINKKAKKLHVYIWKVIGHESGCIYRIYFRINVYIGLGGRNNYEGDQWGKRKKRLEVEGYYMSLSGSGSGVRGP